MEFFSKPTLTILMSTYNGQKYISEQLNSILSQTYENWKLLIRDDGSNDGTQKIISEYSKKDERIVIVDDGLGNLGSAGSFLMLLKRVDTACFMFSDQDDIWLPDKVSITLSRISSDDIPQLVFTDLHVVDKHLNVLSDSFMKLSRFDTLTGVTFSKLIIQNIVVGCTMAGNQRLIERSGLLNSELIGSVVMHDWWLALTACVHGKLIYVSDKTILYRQHGNNHIGVKKLDLKRYIKLLLNEKPWIKARDYLNMVTKQAKAFRRLNESSFTPRQKAQINLLISTRERAPIQALLKCFINSVSMHKFDRNFALLVSLIGLDTRKKWK